MYRSLIPVPISAKFVIRLKNDVFVHEHVDTTHFDENFRLYSHVSCMNAPFFDLTRIRPGLGLGSNNIIHENITPRGESCGGFSVVFPLSFSLKWTSLCLKAYFLFFLFYLKFFSQVEHYFFLHRFCPIVVSLCVISLCVNHRSLKWQSSTRFSAIKEIQSVYLSPATIPLLPQRSLYLRVNSSIFNVQLSQQMLCFRDNFQPEPKML